MKQGGEQVVGVARPENPERDPGIEVKQGGFIAEPPDAGDGPGCHLEGSRVVVPEHSDRPKGGVPRLRAGGESVQRITLATGVVHEIARKDDEIDRLGSHGPEERPEGWSPADRPGDVEVGEVEDSKTVHQLRNRGVGQVVPL